MHFILGLPIERGGVDHLAPETVRRVCPPQSTFLCMTAFEAHQMAPTLTAASQTAVTFVGLEEYQLVVVPRLPTSGMHAEAPSSDASIAGDTGTGRSQLKPADYGHAARVVGCEYVETMHDALPCDQEPSRKRNMAEARTVKWASEAGVGSPLTVLAPVRPASPPTGEKPETAPVFPDGDGVAMTSVTLGEIPADRSKYIHRCLNAHNRHVVTTVASLPALVDTLASILTTPMETKPEDVIVMMAFPLQLARKGIAIVRSQQNDGATNGECYVNLWDPQYEKNTDPLAPSCGCMPCTRHTRGYMHHLLRVHEMNSDILLYEHNLHVVMSVLRQATRLAANNQWSTKDLAALGRSLWFGR
jgi:hypothetical protein